mgnify:CR=1 FL=1
MGEGGRAVGGFLGGTGGSLLFFFFCGGGGGGGGGGGEGGRGVLLAQALQLIRRECRSTGCTSEWTELLSASLPHSLTN